MKVVIVLVPFFNVLGLMGAFCVHSHSPKVTALCAASFKMTLANVNALITIVAAITLAGLSGKSIGNEAHDWL
jgi:hypothetical protein